ncbi:MAG: GatB/YqeY domain-containing protein [Clostridia bacterium]|nr:GatB/YqeY domain-containing protein [Clostridia bacterium]
MIKDEIKKANLVAMKNKDQVARGLYSVVLNKIMMEEVKRRTTVNEMTDGDVLAILQKTAKELEEEKAGFEKIGNAEKVAEIDAQQKLVEAFLPQLMSKDEILSEILKLEDKSVGNVMKHFKQNFNGKCDMALVKKVLDEQK